MTSARPILILNDRYNKYFVHAILGRFGILCPGIIFREWWRPVRAGEYMSATGIDWLNYFAKIHVRVIFLSCIMEHFVNL